MEPKIIEELYKLINKAIKKDESPVAAIITYDGKIVAKEYNHRNSSNLTIDHAEIRAINKANKKLGNWRINKCSLYVTLEPCDMCKSVIRESRIDSVYYLVPRQDIKKQYNKTSFHKLEYYNEDLKNMAKNYEKIIKKYWQNKR